MYDGKVEEHKWNEKWYRLVARERTRRHSCRSSTYVNGTSLRHKILQRRRSVTWSQANVCITIICDGMYKHRQQRKRKRGWEREDVHQRGQGKKKTLAHHASSSCLLTVWCDRPYVCVCVGGCIHPMVEGRGPSIGRSMGRSFGWSISHIYSQ